MITKNVTSFSSSPTMVSLHRLILFLFCILIAAPLQVRAQGFQVIPNSGKWVTDLGGMLSDSEERRLSKKLDAYEDTTSTQIVIVTLPSLDGVPESTYAIELGRQWKVGQEGQDNGIVILASRDDRKVFIATGYGLEGAIPDALAGRIIQSVIVPNFRQGQFYEGFSNATDALVLAARGEFTALPGSSNEPFLDPDLIRLLIFLAIFMFIIYSRGGGGGGKKYRSRRRGDFPVILWGPTFGGGHRGGGGFGGGGFGGGGFGGFGGGGGSFGGGGAGGGW